MKVTVSVLFVWSLSKLMAFLLFIIAVGFDSCLVLNGLANKPETLFKVLPYVMGLIGWKQAWDGADKLVNKPKEDVK